MRNSSMRNPAEITSYDDGKAKRILKQKYKFVETIFKNWFVTRVD